MNLKAITLMYHDVVEHEDPDGSGFPGATAALYKLEREDFARHLQAIASAVERPPVTVTSLLDASEPPEPNRRPWMITFDDGGESAYTRIAGMLEERSWRGHFFIPTDFVDTPTFLQREQIRELHRRGHVIGSHSASHPLRMASRPRDDLEREWRTSLEVLSDVVGERVVAASVPGGQFSATVADAAAEAGVRALFTSEPTATCHEVNGALVLGRYAVRRSTTAQTAADLARGKFGPCLKQRLMWDAKKAMKAVGGERYFALRAALLERRSPSPVQPRADTHQE